MSCIEIISASAGSGKTYRLSECVIEAIQNGSARPEAIVATTFTNDAADELAQRVRERVFRAGLHEEAHRLMAARIGTVNAVCGRLVSEHAFRLGVSPGLRVLDEVGQIEVLRRVLDRAASPDEKEELSSITRSFDAGFKRWGSSELTFEWTLDVDAIISACRLNRINPDALDGFARDSVALARSLLAPAAKDGEALDRDLLKALDVFLSAVDTKADATQATANTVDIAEKHRRTLRWGRSIPWREWLRLATSGPGAKSRAHYDPVQKAAERHDRHPELHRQLERAITLVFEIAGRTLRAYQEHKAEYGLLDFVDQETLALRLLEMPEVQRELADQIDLVVVDEFQDTSPIQLAIFLALSRIAKRCVWVGDQKQAIYGFRGTDPELMSACIESLASDDQEVLPHSWRSRVPLVELTSDVFAPVFERQGIPPRRTRLTPAPTVEPDELGPAAEVWRLANQGGRPNGWTDAQALASAIKDMLDDAKVLVRDRITSEPRPIEPGDIAVLCRRNDQCVSAADGLAELGIDAVLPRMALLSTREGRLLAEGLRLWVDPYDSLAAATLARLVTHATDEIAWLDRIVTAPGIAAFASDPLVTAIAEARESLEGVGLIAAFDAVSAAVDATTLCRRWGRAEQRLANLDRLRGEALIYAERAQSNGMVPTVAGYLGHLERLAESELDAQALVGSRSAVVLKTIHTAKGLEWPVTVLFSLQQRSRQAAGIGVTCGSTGLEFDAMDPLRGRRIRYCPYPYGSATSHVPFMERLHDTELSRETVEREDREDLRLLYVGWTRARDRIVLAARTGKLLDGYLGMLRDVICEPGSGSTVQVRWAGTRRTLRVRTHAPSAPVATEPTTGLAYPQCPACVHPPAFVQPSSMPGHGRVVERFELGPRITLSGNPDMAALGEAVHGFIACDDRALPTEVRRDIARRLLNAWTVDEHLSTDELIGMCDRFGAWVGEHFGSDARTGTEIHVQHRLESGSIMRGIVDALIEADGGHAVIDHKSFPGMETEAERRVEERFAGQLLAYGDAVAAATGGAVLGLYVHLPLLGRVMRLCAADGAATR